VITAKFSGISSDLLFPTDDKRVFTLIVRVPQWNALNEAIRLIIDCHNDELLQHDPLTLVEFLRYAEEDTIIHLQPHNCREYGYDIRRSIETKLSFI